MSSRAIREVEEIRDKYLSIDPYIAQRFEYALEKVLERAVKTPEQGPIVDGVRRLIIGGSFSYAVFYIATSDRVTIYAVGHQRRKPGYWRKEKNR
jgi:plasmid stabilization system protein ParE